MDAIHGLEATERNIKNVGCISWMKSKFVIVLKNAVTCLKVVSEAVQIRKASSRDEKLCVSSSVR